MGVVVPERHDLHYVYTSDSGATPFCLLCKIDDVVREDEADHFVTFLYTVYL